MNENVPPPPAAPPPVQVQQLNELLEIDALTMDSAMWESDSEASDVVDSENIPVDIILNFFRYNHGRRWNRDGQYLLPTDKPEVIRLENQHRLCYTILGDSLYLPNIEISETAKILDVGCSSGIWAIEMATKFPRATVIGVDISPQQTGQPIPPNCSFQFHDIINAPFPFPANTFDFVHIRDMQSAVTVPWETFLLEIHRVLVPGGVAHFGEFIYEHYANPEKTSTRRQFPRSYIKKFEQQLHLFAQRRGSTVFNQGTLLKLLKPLPFTPAREEIITVPIGLWGRRGKRLLLAGQMLTNLLDGLNSFGTAILENMGMDKDEAQRLVTEVAQQYKECTKWRMSMNMMYCAVRKI